MADDPLSELDICRRFGWSIQDFRAARLISFPGCGHRATGALGRLEPVWSRGEIERWESTIRALLNSGGRRSTGKSGSDDPVQAAGRRGQETK